MPVSGRHGTQVRVLVELQTHMHTRARARAHVECTSTRTHTYARTRTRPFLPCILLLSPEFFPLLSLHTDGVPIAAYAACAADAAVKRSSARRVRRIGARAAA